RPLEVAGNRAAARPETVARRRAGDRLVAARAGVVVAAVAVAGDRLVVVAGPVARHRLHVVAGAVAGHGRVARSLDVARRAGRLGAGARGGTRVAAAIAVGRHDGGRRTPTTVVAADLK